MAILPGPKEIQEPESTGCPGMLPPWGILQVVAPEVLGIQCSAGQSASTLCFLSSSKHTGSSYLFQTSCHRHHRMGATQTRTTVAFSRRKEGEYSPRDSTQSPGSVGGLGSNFLVASKVTRVNFSSLYCEVGSLTFSWILVSPEVHL